jgi:selenocysteine lyase/cysteine desulfurase
MPGIAGLLAGVRYVRARGVEAICQKERQMAYVLAEGLRDIPNLKVFAQPGLRDQAGVLSVVPEGRDVETLAADLAEHDIAVRAGLHCAPSAHRSAGTLDTGTVRLSVSDFNTPEEVFRALAVFHELLA